jgi:hypothetical protein
MHSVGCAFPIGSIDEWTEFGTRLMTRAEVASLAFVSPFDLASATLPAARAAAFFEACRIRVDALNEGYPPRSERDRLDQTPHRGDDYMDDILPLLEENAGLGADKSGAEYTNDILSLLEKNAQLRGLVAKLSNIILKSVADQK